jgi:hypothetical protein
MLSKVFQAFSHTGPAWSKPPLMPSTTDCPKASPTVLMLPSAIIRHALSDSLERSACAVMDIT